MWTKILRINLNFDTLWILQIEYWLDRIIIKKNHNEEFQKLFIIFTDNLSLDFSVQ